MASFYGIFLVDADGIDEDPAGVAFVTHDLKIGMKIGPHAKRMSH
jgi:hypothetical protein